MVCFVPKSEHHATTDGVETLLFVFVQAYDNDSLAGVWGERFAYQCTRIHVRDARHTLQSII